MTVLTAIQRMAPLVGLKRPSSVFDQNTDQAIELQVLAQDVAEMIRDAHPWQELAKRRTIAGAGTLSSYAIGDDSDFDRMPKDMQVWTSRLQSPMHRITSLDHWNEIEVRDEDFTSGAWIVYDDLIHFKPTPAPGETISFFYQSTRMWKTQLGSNTNIDEVEADANIFRLSERLLMLGMVWRFRQLKGVPYAEDMATYEEALGQEILKDKPGEGIVLGRGRTMRGVRVAYPLNIE